VNCLLGGCSKMTSESGSCTMSACAGQHSTSQFVPTKWEFWFPVFLSFVYYYRVAVCYSKHWILFGFFQGILDWYNIFDVQIRRTCLFDVVFLLWKLHNARIYIYRIIESTQSLNPQTSFYAIL
jgi:hypothetical protein